MGKVLVGTASWTDKSLIESKRFYPPGCSSAEQRLRFYAAQFPLVEVDSSYYAMPSATNAQLWAERTPADFVFSIKAFRLMTGHQTPRAAFPKDVQPALPASDRPNLYYKDVPAELRSELWRRYREAIEPLRRAGKLGVVHFQFAPWVTRTGKSREHIEHCAVEMAGYRLAVEFRHQSWFDAEHAESTLSWERALDLVNVIVDEPQGFKNSIPAVWIATSQHLAIVRLHGRNHATWNDKTAQAASDRFNYEYSDDELLEVAHRIKVIADVVSHVYVVFNNNYEDQGQRNARTLMALLAAP